jgi:hypothetical protein
MSRRTAARARSGDLHTVSNRVHQINVGLASMDVHLTGWQCIFGTIVNNRRVQHACAVHKYSKQSAV